MNQSALCLDDAEVEELLSGEMALERTSELEQHLTACIDCREKLEHQVGDEGWWCDTQSSLRTGMLSERPSGTDEDSPERLLELLGPTDDPNMLGRIGAYEIIGLLGQGGMGAVFKGFDRSLNRFVAIKMLLPHLAASGAARKRFAREGQAVAAVVDDHVMAIHCVDEWQGVPYLVMTYSRGVSLQRRLQENGPLEVREILRIGMQAAKGLAAAHSQGIVHRDIKPANFFLDDNVERVQLMDFGLARAVDDASLTRSGTLAGTPQYMSPEQARAETVEHRSDLFSLGSVLYAMCVGHAPFRADTSYGVLRLITDTEPRPIRESNAEIPEWLCMTIEKLMSKQPSERFASAAEVAEVLEDCLAHTQHPTTTPLPKSVVAISPQRASRPPWLKFIAAAAAAAFIFIGFAGVILLEMEKGTIRIESNSTVDVPIRIIQGETIAREMTVSQEGATTRLRAGTYRIEVDGKSTHLEISGDRVTLKRRETWLAKIDVRSERERSATEASRPSDEQTATAIEAETVSDTLVPDVELPSDTQVHVVGCYGPVNHQPIEVFVKSTGKPMVVVLCCYSVANWNWSVDPEADVRGVILSGYNIQQFSHTAPKKSVPTIINTYSPVWKGITNSEKEERSKKCFYVDSPLEEKDFQRMLDRVAEVTGRNVTSFQTIPEAKEFVIDGKRGLEELEIAKRWLAFATGQDKNSERFRIIDYKLRELLVERELPTPTRQLTEKMDALNIPRLVDGTGGIAGDSTKISARRGPDAHPPKPNTTTPWADFCTEDPSFDGSAEVAALSSLNAEFRVMEAAYRKARDEAEDDSEVKRIRKELDPRAIMPAKYLAFEEKQRGTHSGLKALRTVARMAKGEFDPATNAHKALVEARRRLTTHYLDHHGLESIAELFDRLPFYIVEADGFRQTLADKSPHRETRAKAMLAQIVQGKDLLFYESELPGMLGKLVIDEEDSPQFNERLRNCRKKLENMDFKQLRADLNEKLKRLADSYSDVIVENYGTAGVAAQRLGHAINKVIVGADAPEITATDINGKGFRLSKLRGKVVVLLFAEHEDDYKEMYGPLRQLVAKYDWAPVEFVGIMSNSDPANLLAASERGDLPWRVIAQPLHNAPLQLDWGIERDCPVYIVDKQGILQRQLHMPYYGDGGYDAHEVDDKIAELLKNPYYGPSAVPAINASPSPALSPAPFKRSDTKRLDQSHATPETLMKRYAECQMKGDVVGCLDCYSDEVINGFAASYLMTAMIMHGAIFPGSPNDEDQKLAPEQQRFRDELEKLLKEATIENPPAIASTALLQAAEAYFSDNDSVKRGAITNDQATLIATSPTMLKDPRQFVKDFALWSEASEDEQSKKPLPKNRKYRIQYDGDSVWSVRVDDNSRMGLKRFGDTWLIHEPWSEAPKAGDPVGGSVRNRDLNLPAKEN